jgi:hypothetical protein
MTTQTRRTGSLELSEVQLLERVPFLTDRMIVDLVNGLEVSGEHIRVRERRSGFFARAWDGLTGVSALRQQAIDKNFQAGLETVNVYLQNLQANQLQSDRALTVVATKLSETREGLKLLVGRHLALRDQVEALEARLDSALGEIHHRHAAMHAELNKMGLRLSALTQLGSEFDAWDAGRYAPFQPLTQLALVLEALHWGPFGQYDRQNPEFRRQLHDKIVIRLKVLMGVSPDTLISSETWFLPVHQEGMACRSMLSDVFELPAGQEERWPLQSALVRVAEAPEDEPNMRGWFELYRPSALPFVLSSERMAERLSAEVAQRLQGRGEAC